MSQMGLLYCYFGGPTYTYIYIHVHMYRYIYIYTHIVHMYLYTYICNTHKHAYMYACVHVIRKEHLEPHSCHHQRAGQVVGH